jgi:hypothetical protein
LLFRGGLTLLGIEAVDQFDDIEIARRSGFPARA